MRTSIEKPPIWEEANAFFRLEELKLGTIFTYGDTIYNPFNVELTQDLIVHEEVHMAQQNNDPTVAKLWWQRYMADPAFRLQQEVEAYGAQYRFICWTVKDRNAQARQLFQLAGFLSGPMYGSVTSQREAMSAIRVASKKPVKFI